MKYLASFLLLAAMTAPCFARNDHSANIQFSHPVRVGSAILHEGNYKMVWDDSKPQVKVSFFMNGKAVVTADASLTVAENAVPSSQPEFTFSQQGGTDTLDSIEMRHMTLVFSGTSAN